MQLALIAKEAKKDAKRGVWSPRRELSSNAKNFPVMQRTSECEVSAYLSVGVAENELHRNGALGRIRLKYDCVGIVLIIRAFTRVHVSSYRVSVSPAVVTR
jgi:hypothetical protein